MGVRSATTEMPVDVQLADGVSAPVRAIARAADAVVADVAPGGDVCIRVVACDESQSLNARYRNLNKPTNVLSFQADVTLPDGQRPLLGDLVICAPVVEREAREQHKPLPDHYAHMVVHGVLHLVGYDHEEADDAHHMECRELAILGTLGVPDPYTVGALK